MLVGSGLVLDVHQLLRLEPRFLRLLVLRCLQQLVVGTVSIQTHQLYVLLRPYFLLV